MLIRQADSGKNSRLQLAILNPFASFKCSLEKVKGSRIVANAVFDRAFVKKGLGLPFLVFESDAEVERLLY
jgi:hypothetical protein